VSYVRINHSARIDFPTLSKSHFTTTYFVGEARLILDYDATLSNGNN
jgi:hypothetical protein